MKVRWTSTAIGHLTTIYEVATEEIRVLAVIHGAQQLPPDLPTE